MSPGCSDRERVSGPITTRWESASGPIWIGANSFLAERSVIIILLFELVIWREFRETCFRTWDSRGNAVLQAGLTRASHSNRSWKDGQWLALRTGLLFKNETQTVVCGKPTQLPYGRHGKRSRVYVSNHRQCNVLNLP